MGAYSFPLNGNTFDFPDLSVCISNNNADCINGIHLGYGMVSWRDIKDGMERINPPSRIEKL